MKKFILSVFLILAVFCLIFKTSEAKQSQIAFVDFKKILQESEAGKKAKNNIESFIQPKRAKLIEKNKQIKELEKELENQATVLSEEAKEKKREDIQKMVRDLRRVDSDVKEEFMKKEAELIKEIFKEVTAIINDIAKEKGFTAVIQKTEGLILYTSEEVDITDLVIKKYDNLKKAKGIK